MRIHLQRFPFVRLCLALIAGIVLANHFEIASPLAVFACVVGLTILVAGFHFIPFRWAKRVAGFLLLVDLMVLGFLVKTSDQLVNQTAHFSHFLAHSNECILRIEQVKDKYLVASVRQINGRFGEGKIILRKYKEHHTLNRFDLIFSNLQIREIPAPSNPKEFDFRRFQASKKVFHQSYLNDFLLLERDYASRYALALQSVRKYCQDKLDQIRSENERAIAKALIIGDKRELGHDLKNTFADTGAMHILAVSGLHVGIVYSMVFLLLSFLPKGRWPSVLRSLLTIAIIWLFAMLAGGLPAVRRAAVMFSLFEMGRLINRSTYPLNSLGAAAFFFLLIDPNSIYDVGFQLSFLAVAGIITCHKPIEELWTVKHKVGYWFWSLVCVALSAQLFTLPLSLYYFHQFPVYFWLSGLVVVPLAYVILSLGLLYLALAAVSLVGDVLLYLLNGALSSLNAFINLFHQIPHVSIEGIWLQRSELIMVILFVALLSIGLAHRNGGVLKIGFVSMLGFSLMKVTLPQYFAPVPTATIYHIQKNSYADLLVLGSGQVLNISELKEPSTRYELRNQYDSYGIRQLTDYFATANRSTRKPFIELLGNRIMMVSEPIDVGQLVPPVDLIWLQNGAQLLNLDQCKKHLPKFVIDGSIPRREARKLASTLSVAGHQVHSTWVDGALSWHQT